MSVALIVLAIVLAPAALVTGIYVAAATRASTGPTRIRSHGDGSLDVRTAAGRAHARPVLHDAHGHVYEVRMDFRGQPVQIAYVPPAPNMAIRHILQSAEESQATRSARRLAGRR